MTQFLEKAFEKVQHLSDDEQNTFAELISLKLDEQHWSELFESSKSQTWLEEMGAIALEEHRAGKTQTLKIEDL